MFRGVEAADGCVCRLLDMTPRRYRSLSESCTPHEGDCRVSTQVKKMQGITQDIFLRSDSFRKWGAITDAHILHVGVGKGLHVT